MPPSKPAAPVYDPPWREFFELGTANYTDVKNVSFCGLMFTSNVRLRYRWLDMRRVGLSAIHSVADVRSSPKTPHTVNVYTAASLHIDGLNRTELLSTFRSLVRELFLHEVDEGFVISGQRPFDPHANENV